VKVSYSLVDDGDGTFTINKDSGEIVNLKQLDYETRTVYKLHVKTTDRGASPLSSTTIVSLDSSKFVPIIGIKNKLVVFLSV